nr:MAG TPA: hypothetical protein [Caudoviricetes sp.]
MFIIIAIVDNTNKIIVTPFLGILNCAMIVSQKVL